MLILLIRTFIFSRRRDRAADARSLAVFYSLDRHWLHRLLYGAVNVNIAIEKAIQTVIPELDLGGHISRQSPIVFHHDGRESSDLDLTNKMDVVYGVVAVLILGIAFVFA